MYTQSLNLTSCTRPKENDRTKASERNKEDMSSLSSKAYFKSIESI